ncbi:MAG: fatty acid desaturase [Thermosynechococcaceae cyanobacterium]
MTATLSSHPAAAQAETLQLRTIIQSLPKSCFEQDPVQAWQGLGVSVLSVALGYGFIAISPWFLLPLAWVVTGTALTGFFVISHDCGHRSFAKQRWVNDWVGHIFMLPLIYPFHSWRILHNIHHAHTNKLDVDNAWLPAQPQDYDQLPPAIQFAYGALRSYFWWVGSIAHWAKLHLDWTTFEGKERQQVKVSVLAVLAFSAIFFPTLIATTGLWGLVKFWLVPWLVYHFWMSTFTLVHHTAPHIPFKPDAEWDAAEAQLMGTVHCDYPHWVEVLCHDINVHIPHHISTAIPSYRLRLAHQSLKANWGGYLQECRFSWALMKTIVQTCHIYDRDRNYKSCKDHLQGRAS